MEEGRRNNASDNWALLIKEDNKGAKKALAKLKESREGKEYRLERIPGIVPTYKEVEI